MLRFQDGVPQTMWYSAHDVRAVLDIQTARRLLTKL